MNEDMKTAWLEISQMLGEPTKEELDVFLRTWQRAIQAEREACAKVCEGLWRIDGQFTADEFAAEVRARSNT